MLTRVLHLDLRGFGHFHHLCVFNTTQLQCFTDLWKEYDWESFYYYFQSLLKKYAKTVNLIFMEPILVLSQCIIQLVV